MQRPQQDMIIMTTKDTSGKIHIREQSGHYQKIRRYLAWVLMCIFLCLPWIQFEGRQAFRIDVERFAIEFFGVVLLKQDFLVLALLFAFAAFALFYVTKFFGRVWCGYACPQTIWTLMFVWIERRIEGPAAKSRALDSISIWGKGGFRKLLIRSVKHASWAVVSLITAITFVSYFTPAHSLYRDLIGGDLSGALLSWILFFAICTYLNAGLVREKVCQHMCPYARFQSSMFESGTKLVTYDTARGENRGARKKGGTRAEGLGDCVDCKLCVQVCPVGIDIRNGIQYECINCGLCIDACEETMHQFGYAPGLIAYQGEGKSRTSHHVSYGIALAVVLVVFGFWFQSWETVDMTITRDRQQLYRINDNREVENTYVIRLNNKTYDSRQFNVELAGLATARLQSDSKFILKPLEDKEFVLTVITDECAVGRQTNFELKLVEDNQVEVVTRTANYFSEKC
jgi:cytochrome c oxidase accessory protein FixG